MLHYTSFLSPRSKPFKNVDNNIYTFDIETTSFFTLNGQVYDMTNYLDLDEKEKNECSFGCTMYIWMLSVNNVVYYGREWNELIEFLSILNNSIPLLKIIYVHNLSFEFNFLKSIIYFDDVFARKAHKPIYATSKKYNIQFRCSYFLMNCALAQVPKLYNLKIKKQVGDLDYFKLRHSKTPLTSDELRYCEYDCLVVYEAIKIEVSNYGAVKNIPLTSTGHVRKALRKEVASDFLYKQKTRKMINTDPHIYNLLVKMFTGGYTHANALYTGTILANVDSFDFSSSYPYVMCTHPFPTGIFKKANIKSVEDLLNKFAYILRVKFTNIKTKTYHSFISRSKCNDIRGGVYDNGRIVSADLCDITVTDVDLRFFIKSHTFDDIEFIEAFYAPYGFLPVEFIKFILNMYGEKTRLKGVEGRELEYSTIKSRYNSLFGMSVTNTIKDEVIYSPDYGEWNEKPLTNDDILFKLQEEKNKAFMSFSTGVWITSHARNNLLNCAFALDTFSAYEDTDSLKLIQGYNEKVIEDYNSNVLERIKNVSEILNLDINLFSPKDIKGKAHTMGLFEYEYTMNEFITQGAKKYAYKIGDEIHITVSGVPKKAAKGLKSLDEFHDGYVFKYEDTSKLILQYIENQASFILTDYFGNSNEISDKSGVCLIPTTYVLGKALEYAEYVDGLSSKRAIYIE